MAERPYDAWTLRELFSAAEVAIRELQSHCSGDLLDAYRQVSERVGRPDAAAQITPEALHAIADRVAASQEFADQVHIKLSGMLQAIDVKVAEALSADGG